MGGGTHTCSDLQEHLQEMEVYPTPCMIQAVVLLLLRVPFLSPSTWSFPIPHQTQYTHLFPIPCPPTPTNLASSPLSTSGPPSSGQASQSSACWPRHSSPSLQSLSQTDHPSPTCTAQTNKQTNKQVNEQVDGVQRTSERQWHPTQ